MSDYNKRIGDSRMSIAQKVLFKILGKLRVGKITLYDRGNCVVFSGTESTQTLAVTIHINNVRAYKTILLEGSLGAGKSYILGDWDTDDLSGLIEIFIKNTALFEQIESPIAKIINFGRTFLDKFQPNNITRSKNNILAHYDLGNEFFQLFLDPTMMYSCALYESDGISQEEASIAKLRTICRYLDLKKGEHIVEIGTGWGGFAIFAAREYGCKVTTTTISDKQYNFVKGEIKRLSLENQIELLNVDYRQLSGQYDKLVSIEMIEAVGHKYFDTFFHKCNQLIKPGGLFFLQAIVINDQAYARAKNEVDFIKKYIFPGGALPSVNAICQSIAAKTKLQLTALSDIGRHYVITLNDWNNKLLANRDSILRQGFNDQFIRMWQFYFCYSAAGFKTHYLGDIQALWRKLE